LTFHVDNCDLPKLTKVLDVATTRFTEHPDFRGLLCLDHDSFRNEIMVISLWDGQGIEDTDAEQASCQQQISAVVDLGVSSRCYDVLRMVPGSPLPESLLEHVS
jgi:hypothetical protein